MVQVNEHHLPDTAACQGLGSPGTYAANADDGDTRLPDALSAIHTVESFQTAKAALEIVCIWGRIAQTARSSRQFWYLRAMTAPDMMPATARILAALRVEMPLKPCPTVHPIAVTPPMPIRMAPIM
jgi:hypothetical protein